MPFALANLLSDQPQWFVAGAVVVLGLFLYGFRDLIHFSFLRSWAISSVCFAESVRRRVLWIIPLTILGVIVVAQLQHPLDEQDAIRQSTKFCLFATGLVVTITSIILACTNLPKEIESRVIFTIVTKPISRLEIIVGKVIGFVRVSATILIIMGVFTFAYMQIRAWSLDTSIAGRLKDQTTDAPTLATLKHYHEAGLLNSRTYATPGDMQVLARPPRPSDPNHWMFGADGNFTVPFQVSREQLIPPNDPSATPGSAGVYILAHIGYDEKSFANYLASRPSATPPPSAIPDTIAAPKPATKPVNVGDERPSVTFEILDQNQNSILDTRLISGGKASPVPSADGKGIVVAYIEPAQADVLLKSDVVLVRVRGIETRVEFSVDRAPVELVVPLLSGVPNVPPPLTQGARPIPPMADTADPKQPAAPEFSSSLSTYGVQLRGGDTANIPVAVYTFRGAKIQPDAQGNVPLELRVGIERGGDESSVIPTQVKADIVNMEHPDQIAYSTIVNPEIGRTAFFTVPGDSVTGGNFNVELHCLNPGQLLGVQTSSLSLVVSEHSFVINLVKSLLVLWLMSFLVVIVSIFCSTFLSWPIATVLTVLILLGRWAVMQLGDATAPGIGNMVATDMGLRDPSKMLVVSNSVELLAKLLNNLAKVLPDISKFSALEDIERGVSLSPDRLTDALLVIVIFGIPLMVVSYVFLRQKEVAP